MMTIYFWIKKTTQTHIFLSLFLISVLLSLLIYFPGRSIGYLSDDWGYAYLGQHATAADAVSFLWSADALGSGRGNFRPLPSILTVFIWGPLYEYPNVLHLISIILHGIVASLVGLLVFRLWQNKSAAYVSAFAFVTHPLNTEVVLWLCTWNALLAMVPLLVALIFYTKTPKRLAVIGLLVLLSLMSKEYGLLAPIFLFGIDILLKRKFAWVSYLFFIGIDILYFVWRFTSLGRLGGYVTGAGSSAHARLTQHDILEYAKLPFSYVYNYFNRTTTPEALTFIAHALPVVLIGVCVYFFYKTRKREVVLPLLVLVALVYAGNILGWNLVNSFDLHTEHSRILYASTMWVTILLGFIWSVCPQKVAKMGIIVYLIFLPVLARYQMIPWLKAGQETRVIHSELAAQLKNNPVPSKIIIRNLPDSYRGAYIHRNGIEFAVALMTHTIKGTIPVEKTVQTGLEKQVEIMAY